ncbi:MAG TPA: hypothetical protein VK805_06830 [Candidatus Baltobacteraceae bacterium]|nr:hypothetical protein [Candidatus Baltobacteraceae bacterium]
MWRILANTSATTPPLEVMPTANVVALAMQAGHIVVPLSRRELMLAA